MPRSRRVPFTHTQRQVHSRWRWAVPFRSFSSECTNTPCVPVCTLWSHFLFHIHSYGSWKHLFVITRQTLLEPIRLCVAAELDFPACKAGMGKHWVHNASWRECSVSGFLLIVSSGPLSAHWGAAAAELERLAWLLCPRERLQQRGKAVLQKLSQRNQGVGPTFPTSPRGFKAAFPICSFLVCPFPRTRETTKPYTKQWICSRTIFSHLPSS